MIFYFTGTGNSLWAARELGAALGEQVGPVTRCLDVEECLDDDLVGFVVPTYVNDLPWLVKRCVLNLGLRADAYVFAVMTSSTGKSGRAARSLDQGLATRGSHLDAAFDLQMPGNCVPGSPGSTESRLAAADERLADLLARVRAREQNFSPDGSVAGPDYVEGSPLYGSFSLRRLTPMRSFRVTDDCNGCGLCARICPVGNIGVSEGRARHKDACAGCYACMHWCPRHATLPRLPVLHGRPQYRHPDAGVRDLEEQAKASRG